MTERKGNITIRATEEEVARWEQLTRDYQAGNRSEMFRWMMNYFDERRPELTIVISPKAAAPTAHALELAHSMGVR